MTHGFLIFLKQIGQSSCILYLS